MPVTNIECQLVRAQISRYLRGDELPADVMRQLEAHLLACDECKEVLLARKSELRARLAQSPEKRSALKEAASKLRAAVSLPEADEVPKSNPASPEPAATSKKPLRPNMFAKPAAYTVVLAAVLVAMTQMSKGGGLFGPKALESFNTQATLTQTVVPTQPTLSTSVKATLQSVPLTGSVHSGTEVSKSEALTVTGPKPSQTRSVVAPPKVAPASKKMPAKSLEKVVSPEPVKAESAPAPTLLTHPKISLRKISSRKRSARKHWRKWSAIHVYDAQGNPVNP